MTSAIILVFYFILVVIYMLVSAFIVYHLATYTLNAEMRVVMISLFCIISGGLLFSNLILFFSINWTVLFPNNF